MIKKPDIDLSARDIYEAIQQLGWETDVPSLIDRVKRLDLGLPTEDELTFILSWFGKCSIIHKLDQNQYPLTSSEKYQVPDLFACFDTNGASLAVLLEVKVSTKKKLSWKEGYLDKLRNYSSLVRLPILLAWKFHRLWLLVDLNRFEKARTNYHLTYKTAIRNNLMSYLAGDFAYVMKPNVGLHFHLKKETLVSKKHLDSTSRDEVWQCRIEKAFFTNSEGKEVSNLPPGLWPLFISAEPVCKDLVEDDYIYQSFIISKEHGMQFAHAALPILICLAKGAVDKIHWRKRLKEHKFPVDFTVFRDAVDKGIREGFTQYGIHIQPANIPAFLKHLEKAKHSTAPARE